MLNANGNPWANQFVIAFEGPNIIILQSYRSTVAMIDFNENHVTLGDDWDYSKTTMRAVNKFLSDNLAGKWDSKRIRKALETGEDVNEYTGRKWTFANGSDDFFNDFFKR